MKLTILSKCKISAIEQNLTEFLAEDIVDAINSNDTIVFSEQELKLMQDSNPEYKYCYELKIERI